MLWGTTILLSTELHHFTILTAVHKTFKLSNIYFLILNNNHSNGTEVISHCSFDRICQFLKMYAQSNQTTKLQWKLMSNNHFLKSEHSSLHFFVACHRADIRNVCALKNCSVNQPVFSSLITNRCFVHGSSMFWVLLFSKLEIFYEFIQWMVCQKKLELWKLLANHMTENKPQLGRRWNLALKEETKQNK